MKKSKTPQDILSSLRKANPNASAAELKELIFGEFQKSPQLAKSMFDELFDLFLRETGFRGDPQNGLMEFEAWLKRLHN
ncbi:hypothetical protein JQ615_09685 [Bradyrhizobium jicamae]|uniref:Uncharacterized protein n=1 Tax=Bradyrhizobium jicamae TaxID=280332 RepID=A0ABS5FFW7_9BRAD|nr:hypothetical protein [Bradyrhizobium jicamae]MBR0795657.1 hypothetical protein [Bradyrhizobium jicamae]